MGLCDSCCYSTVYYCTFTLNYWHINTPVYSLCLKYRSLDLSIQVVKRSLNLSYELAHSSLMLVNLTVQHGEATSAANVILAKQTQTRSSGI